MVDRVLWPIFFSLIKTSPERRECAPTIASTNSVRPAPASPAKPTISPAWILNEIFLNAPAKSESDLTSITTFCGSVDFTFLVAAFGLFRTMRSISQFSSTPFRVLESINLLSRKTVNRSLIVSISDMR